MASNIFRNYAFITISLIILNSCNKDSFIEDVGFVNETESTPNTPKGKILFYATNGFIESCSGGLQIYIDGENKGKLTQATFTQPNCGENSAKAITLSLEVGSYFYNASGSGEFCPSYSGNLINIEEDVCLVVNFQL